MIAEGLKVVAGNVPSRRPNPDSKSSMIMDAALANFEQMASAADEPTRVRLIAGLRQLADSMEAPQDTIHRYGHMVGTPTIQYNHRRSWLTSGDRVFKKPLSK